MARTLCRHPRPPPRGSSTPGTPRGGKRKSAGSTSARTRTPIKTETSPTASPAPHSSAVRSTGSAAQGRNSAVKQSPRNHRFSYKEPSDSGSGSGSEHGSDEQSDDASAFEEDDAASSVSSALSAAEENEEEDDSGESDDDEDEEVRPRKKRRTNAGTLARKGKGNTTTNTSAHAADGPDDNDARELWRPGVKTGLGPGKQVVIKRPQARSAGSTPYEPDRIHPNTMLFLADLEQNNDRDWFKMHDPDYRASWADFVSFAESVQARLIEVDDTIPELPVKDCFFRVYRDVRFSKDKTPYKAHFSIAWSRTGRKGPYACYYLQIKPGGHSMLGGGLWMPDAQQLEALRADIDRHPRRLKDVLNGAELQRDFLDEPFARTTTKSKTKAKSKTTAKANSSNHSSVDAFVEHNAATALKTKPRDYAADHTDIALLRLKNFTLGRRLADEEIVAADAVERIARLCDSLRPFITYLNGVVRPDNNQQSGNNSNDDEGEDDDGDASSASESSSG